MDNNKEVLLKADNISARVDGREILHGVDLEIKTGETVVLLGPNGAGKSTLGSVISGHPHYQVTAGEIQWQGEKINDWPLHERAAAGIFLSWQNPPALNGVNLSNFLRQIDEKHTGKRENVFAWRQKMTVYCEQLQLPEQVLTRELGVGFSGGEKKKLEMLQLMTLQPKLAILDELDSGLDADAGRVIRKVLGDLQKSSEISFLIITHTAMILEDLKIDKVLILDDGKIKIRGGRELTEKVKKEGYGRLKEQNGHGIDA